MIVKTLIGVKKALSGHLPGLPRAISVGSGIGGRGVEDGTLDSPRARGIKDMTSHHRGRCVNG